METLINAHGQIVWTQAKTITPEVVQDLPRYAPQRRLVGTKVDWDAMPQKRCSGDDWFYPGIMPNGRRVWVSRSLAFYFE